MDTLKKKIEEIPGYKISNTHFRLGSKIHISDFYYGKRLFQNSFFASRFAFLIAKEIIENHKNIKEKIKESGLTLIGYGLYSELLLSLIEGFLKKTWNIEDNMLNHNLINDIEDIDLIKGYEKIHSRVILIVPIASTFSTSIKIEEEIKRGNKKISDNIDILLPHINILLVSDKEETNVVALTQLARKFGWLEVDIEKRQIEVLAFYEGNHRQNKVQKYFISLPTNWNDIVDCKHCFPEINKEESIECSIENCETCKNKLQNSYCPLNERNLFDTDKSSVTPILIFDYPKPRIIDKEKDLNRKINLDPEHLKYGHKKRDETHYHYYIVIEEFFKRNEKIIKTWLESLKPIIGNKDNEYVLIIAPGHYSNASFVNKVNEVLFLNSASIIHYDPKKDHIQNFQLFYKDEINKADKVYFVDDTITTGSTFIRSNYFLKHTRGENEDIKVNGFDACIVLMDRSSRFVNKNILRKLTEQKIYSFANLHLPALNSIYGECPLCLEKKRYHELVCNSFLDRMKVHFLMKEVKLEVNDIRFESYSNVDDESRHLIKVEAIHRIFEWFEVKNTDFEKMSFQEWRNDLISETNSPFVKALIGHENDVLHLSDATASILKVLTQPPFLNYQPVRKKIFEWITQLLFEQILKVKKEIDQRNLSYDSFRDFKFLIRRAGLLNANFLISNIFFELLELLFKDEGIKNLKEKIEKSIVNQKLEKETIIHEEKVEIKNGEQGTISFPPNKVEKHSIETEKVRNDKLKNLEDFNVFFVAQIKELLDKNEARSIILEERLIKFQIKEGITPSFYQLLRILREENGILIHKFWEFIKSQSKWADFNNSNDISIENIKTILNDTSINKHYRFKTLNEFFIKSKQSAPKDNLIFLNYLILLNYLSKEKDYKGISLNEKTKYILNKILSIGIPENKKKGIFLIIKQESSRFPYFFAYNASKQGIVDENKLESKNNEEIIKFINGKKDNSNQSDQSNKSIIEYYRNQNNDWEDLFSTSVEKEIVKIDPDFVPIEYNHLILLRLNKKYLNDDLKITDDSQGLIGIYFDEDKKEIIDTNNIRYLLLIRESISRFIHNHHENDEFRDLMESLNKQRISLLTGHGRDMLMDIAHYEDDRYKKIIQTILLTQRLIIDAEEERIYRIKRGENDNIKSVESIFKSIFNINNLKDKELTINKNNLKALFVMAEKIFSLNEVENSELIVTNEKDESIEDFIFNFPNEILEMICFELFINAKKNRWIFTENIRINENNVIDKNKIWITNSIIDNKMILTISNTGPEVEERLTKKLTDKKNPKEDKATAGLQLIIKLLDIFELGSVRFYPSPFYDKLFKFNVELTLKEWNEFEKENSSN